MTYLCSSLSFCPPMSRFWLWCDIWVYHYICLTMCWLQHVWCLVGIKWFKAGSVWAVRLLQQIWSLGARLVSQSGGAWPPGAQAPKAPDALRRCSTCAQPPRSSSGHLHSTQQKTPWNHSAPCCLPYKLQERHLGKSEKKSMYNATTRPSSSVILVMTTLTTSSFDSLQSSRTPQYRRPPKDSVSTTTLLGLRVPFLPIIPEIGI